MFDYDGKRDGGMATIQKNMKIVEEYAKVDLVSTVHCFPAVLKECGSLWYISSVATLFLFLCSIKMIAFLL